MIDDQPQRQLIDIRPLVAKIAHELEDIRVCALQNIISKYKNDLIHLEEIVHQKQLMVNLLQWFNFPEPKCVKDVLSLLGSISQNANGATMLCQLGAVEFMGLMRQDTKDPSVRELIEKLLENLFMSRTSFDDNEGNTTDIDDIQRRNSETIQHSNITPRSAVEIINEYSNRTATTTSQQHDQQPPTSIPCGNLNPETINITEPNSSEAYYQVEFNWIPLTISDRSILSVTENRLLSGDASIMTQSCEFFRDVLVQDFPSELFLQRPNLIKALLECLKVHGTKRGLSVVPMPLLECFDHLISKLLSRFNDFLIDELNPMWNSKDAEHNKRSSSSVSFAATQSSSLRSNVSPSTVNNDNHSQQPAQGSTNGDETNYDEFEGDLLTEALKNQEWSPVQLALLTISHCLPLVSSSSKSFTSNTVLFRLLQKSVQILKHFNLRIRWDSREILTDPFSYKYELSTILDCFGKNILEMMRNINCAPLHCITWETSAALLMEYAIDLVDTVLPVDAIQGFMPTTLFDAMKMIIFKHDLVSSYPLLHEKIETVAVVVDTDFALLNKRVAAVKLSIFKLHYFTFSQLEKIDSRILLEILEDAIACLAFVDVTPFIKKVLCVTKTIHKEHSIQDVIKHQSMQLILRLFCHQLRDVEVATYKETLELVKDALNESLVSTPWSLKYKDINWIVEFTILKQICLKGLFSQKQEIKEISQGLLVRLLLSQLEMDASIWQTVIANLLPLLPYLQASMGTDASLDNALIHAFIKSRTSSYLTADGNAWMMPPVVEIKFSLTMMLSNSSAVRRKGFQFATDLLLKADKDDDLHVCYQTNTTEEAYNILVQDTYFHESYINELIGNTKVNKETVTDICTCISVNRNFESRKNAIIQLASICKDHEWNDVIINSNIVTVVMNEFHNSLFTNYGDTYTQVVLNPSKEMILSCATILSNVAESNYQIRLQLSSNRRLYFDILRAMLSMSSPMPDLNFNLLRLLITLLFCSVRTIGYDTNEVFTLPHKILKGYCLPVRFAECCFDKDDTLIDNIDPLPTQMFTEPIITLLKEHSKAIEDLMKKQNHHKTPLNDDQWKSLTTSYLNIHSSNYKLKIIKCSIGSIIENVNQLHTYQQLMSLMLSHSIQCMDPNVCLHSEIMNHLKENKWNSRIFRDLYSNEVSQEKLNIIQMLSILMTSFLDSSCLKLEDTKMLISAATEQLYSTNNSLPSLKSNDGPNNYARNQLQLHLRLLIQLTASTYKYSIPLPNQLIPFIIRTLTDSLHVIQEESHYDLPTLEVTLECLTHLTAVCGWTDTFDQNDLHATVNALVTSLKQIMLSFHANQANASVSFMGKGVVYRAAQALCHMFAEAEHSTKIDKGIIKRTLLDDANGSLNWLTTLFRDRTYEVRWSAWSLATAIGKNFGWSILIKSEVKLHSGGLWAIAVGTMMSTDEFVVVRCQAAHLLCLLCTAATLESGKELWTTMIVEDLFTESVLVGMPAFTVLLQHFQFFEILHQILTPNNTEAVREQNTHDTVSSRDIDSLLSDSTQSSSAVPYKELETTGINKALLPSQDTNQSETSSMKSRDILDGSSVLSNYFETSFYGQLLTSKMQRPQLKIKYHLLTFLNKLTHCLDAQFLSSIIEEIKLTDLLEQMLDASELVSICNEIYRRSKQKEADHLRFRSVCYMIDIYNEIIVCICNCVQSLDIKREFNIKALVDIFSVPVKEKNPISGHITRLVLNTAKLLNVLILKNKDKQKNIINELIFQFDTMSNCILSIFNYFPSRHHNRLAPLIDLLFVTLKANGNCIDFDESTTITVNQLCVVLFSLWRDERNRQSISCIAYRCICQLLSMSEKAKQSIISNGKLKEIMIELNAFHETLETASLLLDKDANEHRMEKSIVCNSIMMLGFLKSIAYQSKNTKEEILKDGIMNILIDLWQWGKVYVDLNSAVVDFVTVLSAHCPEAQKSLCHTNSKSSSFDSPSLLSKHIIYLTKVYNQCLTAKEAPNIKLLSGFNVLINTSERMECRAIMWKSGFLLIFSRLISSSLSTNPIMKKNYDLYLMCWLNLYVALSFHNDSAKLMLKIPDFVSCLMHYSTSNKKNFRHRSLLICRNLLFVTGSKQSFLSNDMVVSSLLDSIECESIETKALTLSALWQMLADNKKAVAVLRRSNLPSQLQTIRYHIQTGKLLSSDTESNLYVIMKRSFSAVSDILTKKTNAVTSS